MSETTPADLARADRLLLDGELDLAKSAYLELLPLLPGPAYRGLGRLLMLRGEHREAADQLDRALAVEPDDALSLAWLGSCRLQLGDPKAAAKLLERAVKLGPDDPELWIGWGRALAGADERTPALTAFQEAIRLAPEHPMAQLGLARGLAALDDLDGAVFHGTESLRLNSVLLPAYRLLVDLLWRQGEHVAAVEFLRRSTQEWPEPALFQLLARAAVLAQDGLRAREAIAWLLANTAPSVERHLDLGALWLALGDLDQAEAEFGAARALAQSDPRVWRRLGAAYEQGGRLAQAEAAYLEATTCAPEWAAPWNDLALLRLRSRQLEEAYEALQRADALDPQSYEVALNLAYVADRLGLDQCALRHAQRARDRSHTPEGLRAAERLLATLSGDPG